MTGYLTMQIMIWIYQKFNHDNAIVMRQKTVREFGGLIKLPLNYYNFTLCWTAVLRYNKISFDIFQAL